ncbi:MAG: hypothetical protein ACREMY_00565, partial [bacterium]
GWYHSKAWRDRMAEVGIVADDHGLTQQRLPQWIAYLNQYGVSVAPLPISDASGATEAPTRSRQLAKWLCGCALARNIIRCSFELAATCNRCGQLFRQA